MERNLDFIRGELVGACRAYLALHMKMFSTQHSAEICGALARVNDAQEAEILRLVHNEFQFHQAELGDPVQFALTVLLMNGEEHSASGRRT